MNALDRQAGDQNIDQLLAQADAGGSPNGASDTTVDKLRNELETIAVQLKKPVEQEPFEAEPACVRAVELAAEVAKKPTQPEQVAPKPKAAKIVEVNPSELGHVGPYKLLKLLGQGGMGAVYKALHPKLDKVVALKVLRAGRIKGELVDRFQREMKALGKLDHPHLIRALDAGDADGTHYLVMEFVAGMDLSALLAKRGKLKVADACELVAQAAMGLHAAHSRGMVHRDIKPANLMLAEQEFGPPVVKVLDLGLALLAGSSTPDEGGLTSDGQIMGTIDYMPPEQAKDSHTVDARADIYSLGATLYALLTGGSVFQGRPYTTLMQKLMALATEPIPSIRERRPDLSPELAAIVHRMIAREPKDRYASPAEVVVALKPYAVGADLSALIAGDSDHTNLEATNVIDLASVKERIAQEASTKALAVSQPVMTSPANSGRKRFPLVIATAVAGVVLLGAILLSLKTPNGEVIVEIPDDLAADVKKDIKINVTGDGAAEVASEANGWKIGIKEGKYKVELTGGGDQVQIDDKQVTVNRNKKAIVTITMKPTGAMAAKGTKPAGEANSDADRRAAEWLLSLHEGPVNLTVVVGGQMTYAGNRQLPAVPFHVHTMSLAGPIINKLGDRLAEELAAKIGGIRAREVWINSDTLTTAGFAKLVAMPEFSEASAILLKCCDRGMDEGVFPLLAKLSDLKALTIVAESHLTGAGIGELKACADLREIEWQVGSLSATAVEELTQLPKLEILNFNTITCTERHMMAMAKLKLRQLGLHACKVDDGMLRHLATMEKLETLRIPHNPITDHGLSEFKQIKSLKTLDIRATKVTDKGLLELKQIKALRTLDLRETTVTAAGVADLQQALPDCKIEWDAPDADRRATEWLRSLNHPPKLDLGKDGNPLLTLQPGQPLPAEKFHLYFIQFDAPEHEELGDEFVDQLAKNISGSKQLARFQFPGRKLTAAGLAMLVRLPELADVYDFQISPESMDDSMVVDLAAMKKLKQLSISRAPKITGRNLGLLKGVSALHLMECPNLTPEGLEELQQLPLELLNIGNVRLTEKHVAAIAGHKKLHRLYSQGIDDSTVAGLANMESLTFLGFENSQITDKGLQELKKFKGLKTTVGTSVISLNGSKVTADGISDLKKALPNCNIE